MTKWFENRVALITGAGAGIGRAAALEFAKRGAAVMVSDVNADGGLQTVHRIEEAGGRAIFHRTDVADAEQVEELVARTVDELGGLHAAFNNAGIEGEMAPLADCTLQNFERVIAVNLRGVFLCMKYEIPRMLAAGGGAIVNDASVAGLVGFAGLPAYVASKHGVNGLTKNAALEYGKQGIRVCSVCPGAIRTRMIEALAADMQAEVDAAFAPLHPLGRIGTPEEVARLAAWLCSDHASFMNGAIIPVDGGYVAQ